MTYSTSSSFVAILALALAAGCSASGGVDNPTGTCAAPDDGSRAGYHAADGSTWLPDCGNTLQREYWRVFAESAESAYLMPRPDGAAELGAACEDTSHALHALVEHHALCHAAKGDADLALVNHIPPADALRVSHELHTHLRFVTDAGLGIAPFPIPSDIVDACALHTATNSAELTAICKREQARLDSGSEEAFSYDGPGAVELAARLNELYGIP